MPSLWWCFGVHCWQNLYWNVLFGFIDVLETHRLSRIKVIIMLLTANKCVFSKSTKRFGLLILIFWQLFVGRTVSPREDYRGLQNIAISRVKSYGYIQSRLPYDWCKIVNTLTRIGSKFGCKEKFIFHTAAGNFYKLNLDFEFLTPRL